MKTKYRLNPNDEAFYLIPNTIDELLVNILLCLHKFLHKFVFNFGFKFLCCCQANGTNERLATTNKCHYAILNVNDCASYVYGNFCVRNEFVLLTQIYQFDWAADTFQIHRK